MSIIEEKIKRNKDWFDSEEPSQNHFENFKSKLYEQFPEENTKDKPKRMFFRIAAVIILIVVAGSILIFTGSNNNKTFAAMATNDENLPAELQELKTYYSTVKDKKIDIINNYSCSNEEACKDLKNIAEEELNQLEKNNTELEQELVESNNNPKVMNAIVNNYQLMSRLLDNVIISLDKTNTTN